MSVSGFRPAGKLGAQYVNLAMKKWVKVLIVLFCLCVTGNVVAEDSLSSSRIIDKDGELVISDGSSLYRFIRGGQFRSEPLGMSGRLIEGTWVSDKDGSFEIQGNWGWLNGMSQVDDSRVMNLSISGLKLESENLVRFPGAQPEKTKLYRGYFVIHRLVSDRECKVNK
jgi:hypothetical protein